MQSVPFYVRPVDHYRQEEIRGLLQEFYVHTSDLRPQKPFKTSLKIVKNIPHILKISHLFKFKDHPNLRLLRETCMIIVNDNANAPQKLNCLCYFRHGDL